MDTVTHQVGHCVREIESALRAVVATSVREQGAPGDAADGTAPKEEHSKGKGKGKGKKDNHERDIRAILAGLGIGEEDPIAEAWLANARGLHAKAHRHALNPPRPLDREFEQFFGAMQEVLREILVRFEGRFASSFRIVDELLGKRDPGVADAQRLKQKVPNTLVTYRRFFEGIPDGRWLGPLREEGFFESPTAAETDEDGAVRHVPWPPSRYLARVAGAEPDLVMHAILEMAPTNNVRVHEDVADAALAMPPALAARIVVKVTPGLDSTSRVSALPPKLAALVAHLARGGRDEAALALVRELLVLVPEETAMELGDDEGVRLPAAVEVVPRFRQPEDYDEAVDACLLPLVDAAGERAFYALSDLLWGAIRDILEPYREEGDEGLPYHDGLGVMRPAIEDSEKNGGWIAGEGAVYRLVSAVRDAAGRVAAGDPSSVGRMVASLEGRENETFDRLALHLLGSFPEAPPAPELIAERLKGRVASLSTSLFHEYAVLLQERFAGLSPEDRGEILRAIAAGPPAEELEEARESAASGGILGNAAGSEEEVEARAAAHADRWRLRRYAPIADLLPEQERGEYERLAAEHPDLAQRDPLFYGDRRLRYVSRGESPKSAQDLLSMPVEGVAAFLKGFEPSDASWEGPGVREVADALSLAVARDPRRFASGAERFTGLDPAYAAAVFSGLRDALRGEAGQDGDKTPNPTTKPSLEWGPVLGLCRWVLEQPRGTSEASRGGARDSGWRFSRLSMAWLLRSALGDRGTIPFRLRGELWGVLEELAGDPVPRRNGRRLGRARRYHP
ncbi:MAG: hypothetical protein M3Q49_07200 [Actinomycetota bacterium]|nr:hypothetical protein [Actinomycetota bacterium]